MQYVAGLSLQQRLDRDGAIGLHEILRIGMQAASGLAAAHAQGLVHRDIKPSNILLENGIERVKVTDFGLARAAADASLTQSGFVAGTPQYMSPEQARGEAVDQRTDLFSLGSVLYAMCAGRAPFRASGSMAVLKRVCEEAPRPIRELAPAIPDWLVAIIDRLHAKDPADRYRTAAEVAELLNRHLAYVQHPSLVPLPAIKPAPARRRRVVAVLALLCLVGGVLGVTAALRQVFPPEGASVVEPVVLPTGGSVVEKVAPAKEPAAPASVIDVWKHPSRWATEMALTRDGKRAVACSGKFLFTFDPGTGAELERFAGHEDDVRSVAFSPDGEWIASGSQDATVRLWKPGTKGEIRRFATERTVDGGTGRPFSYLAFTPDGTRLLAGSRNDLLMWDFESGDLVKRFVGHTGAPRRVAFAPDGRLIASCGHDGTARLWRAATGELLHTLPDGSNWIIDVDFSPDGKFLATGGRTVTLWDVATGTVRWHFPINHRLAEGMAFTPDGRFLVAGLGEFASDREGELVVINVATGHEVHRSGGLNKYIFDVKIAPDGRGVFISEWSHMRLRRLPEGLGTTPSDRAPRSDSAAAGAFVVLGGKGTAGRNFDTLAEAVLGANDGDTIEIRGNGPFISDGVTVGQSLVIRAGEGFAPSITLSEASANKNIALLDTSASLVLEGLELRRIGGATGRVERRHPILLRAWHSGALHVVNCRLDFNNLGSNGGIFVASRCSHLVFRNCDFFTDGRASVDWYCPPGCRGSIENCVATLGGLMNLNLQDPNLADVSLKDRHNTTVGDFLGLVFYQGPNRTPERAPDAPVHLELSANVAYCPPTLGRSAFLRMGQVNLKPFLAPHDAEALLLTTVMLHDKQNVHARGTLMLRHATFGGSGLTVLEGSGGKQLADWNLLWKQPETGSVEGDVRFHGGDLLTRATAAPEKLTAAEFRLRPDSAGYHAGKDGKDLGADVDLVGPGPAYERWKKTPDYQQWLKDIGQGNK